MATTMRLARRGRTHEAIYEVIVADSRAPRDGKFLEKVGFYNPNFKPAKVDFKADKAIDWLLKGAQPSDTVKSLLQQTGVYAKFLAAKRGEDVSNFEITPKPEKERKKKLGPKAIARLEAEKAAKEAPAEEPAAEEAAPAE